MIEATVLPGELTVEVSAPCPAWLTACGEAAALAEQAALLALRRERAPGGSVVDITLADDAAQHALNRTWRGKDSSTNVLAFPAADPANPAPPGAPLLLGDVVLAFETVSREAAEQDKPLADHLRHLVVHGVLHLLGDDHVDDRDATAMEAKEIAILAELGVPNPYRDTM
ncbi:MAG TPA: rRNA maturation RNase YbeY [Stellaceae bacterium]|jgi:probable rRNA maturation factor|nr:rRNA maturation RNase YbeY [Stellaceae bacterium]